MNTQERMIDNRTFRIAVIAVAAAVLLAAAAYLFGTGLRADTSASVAPARSAALAAQAQRRADFYSDLNAAAAASRWASVAAHDESLARFNIAVNATNAAAAASAPAGLYAPGQYQWIRPVGITGSGAK